MSRVLVMCLVVLVVIFVPLQTGKLAELYNSTNKYERARYTPNPNNAHVILSGVITYSAIIDFCREYFVNDPTGHVVILAADPPTLELRRLMRHPYYKNRVHFLCGSPLSTPDLKRCAAQQATGIFLLNQESSEGNSGGEDEQLKVTRGADAEILMQALVIKGGFQGLLIFAEVQDIRTQDLSDTCGCDQTLCLDELKMTLLARNCAVPGVLTLIMNLVHSYKESEDDFEEAWMQEYHYGASNQMQSFKFPPALINRSFGEVYKLLYSAFGLTLFAVINRSGKFILNPGKSYMIKSDDNGICIFHGGDEVLLRLAILFESGHTDLKTIPTMYNREKISQYVKKRFSTTVIQSIGGGGSSSHSNNNTSNDTNSSGVIDGISVTGNTIEVITGDKDVQVVEFQDDQSTTQVIIKSGSLQPDINIASPTSTNTMAAQFDPTSSDAESEITMQALQRPAPKNFSLHHQQEHYSSSSTFQNHIILCGNMTARGIRHFVQTVRSSERNITTQSNTMPIVCLLENVPSVITGIWEDIMKFPKVHLICGTPLKKTNLLNAGIEKCHRIMIFAKKTEVKIGNSDTNSIPDANSIFIVQMIQEVSFEEKSERIIEGTENDRNSNHSILFFPKGMAYYKVYC